MPVKKESMATKLARAKNDLHELQIAHNNEYARLTKIIDDKQHAIDELTKTTTKLTEELRVMTDSRNDWKEMQQEAHKRFVDYEAQIIKLCHDYDLFPYGSDGYINAIRSHIRLKQEDIMVQQRIIKGFRALVNEMVGG